MDLVHEFGHVIWGLLVGGELNLLKIGFLEIYPVPRFVSDFELGKAALSGFESDFSRGIYLLGGSLTTNLVSWVFTVVKDRNIFFIISGIFGLLDLPLYVFLPQIGLRHWIFLGSRMPEPLLAIELIRFPKELFYLLILFSTVILLYLYLGGIEAFSLSEV